jgi:hypothetical protein
MNNRVGIYNKMPAIDMETLIKVCKVQDVLISRHKKWLRKRGVVLDCTVWEMTGCTTEVFYGHFESLFADGMSWSNFGEWQIDHVYPISAVNPKRIDLILGAFNYKNLQPMWAEANSRKGDSITIDAPSIHWLHRGPPQSVQSVFVDDLLV